MKLQMPTPRAHEFERFMIEQIRSNYQVLHLGRTKVYFHQGIAIAVDMGAGTLFYPDGGLPPASTALLNKLDQQKVRVSADNFDFTLAQALISTAMPWTKVPSAEVPMREEVL